MAELKHFKEFQSINDYDTYINGNPILPNVSFVGENQDVYYKNGEPTPPPHDYTQDYLTLTFLEDNGSISSYEDSVYFSTDGENWETSLENLSNGSIVYVKGDVKYFDGSSFSILEVSGRYNAEGNIMSIYDSENFSAITSFNSDERIAAVFAGTEIISAENVVFPATTLAPYCYFRMFLGCSSLVNAPELPATTLANFCYYEMFNGCTSLTTAPELPATTLTNGCYSDMFLGCSSLSSIRCLATDISATACTYSWVNGVSENGTFVKVSDVDWSGKTDYNGIPSGWQVVDV